MSNQMNSLSLATEIKVKGYDGVLKIDFSDSRIKNKVLHLMKYYGGMEQKMTEVYETAKKIEDDLDRVLYVSDAEIEVLEGLKNNINDLFGTDVVTAMFGNCLPSVERYYSLMEALEPYAKQSFETQAKMQADIVKKYNLASDVDDDMLKEMGMPTPEEVAEKAKGQVIPLA